MNTISTEPKTIKRDGEVGFRGNRVMFAKNGQKAWVYDDNGTALVFSITDFLNLVEQATWYFDQFASREER
jgi:hypothetical protein